MLYCMLYRKITGKIKNYRRNTMFKKLISFALVCVMTISCSAVCFADTSMQVVKKEVSVPPNLLVLGDSIAAGVGLEGYTGTGNGPKGCYASILAEKYQKELPESCAMKMDNKAVSGYTSEDLLKQLTSASVDKNVLSSCAVVISIGGNDLMRPALEFVEKDLGLKTPEDIKNFNKAKLLLPSNLIKINEKLDEISANLTKYGENLDKIIGYIKNKAPNTLIVVQTVYNPLDSNKSIETLANMIGGKIDELNAIINSHAKKENGEQNYLVCDVHTAFKGKSSEYTNIDKYDIHPNAEGHKVISELVDKQLRTGKYSYEELVEVKTSNSKIPKMSNTRIYVTVGLFFGGFLTLFVLIYIKFKHNTR